MSVAYIDTSALVAVAFNEQSAAALAKRLNASSRLLSSNLLEAELRAAFTREGYRFEPRLVSGIEWVLPDRSLTEEFERVLRVGYLRGADLWHVATALYLAPEPSEISLITLDDRQRSVATALGFQA